MKEVSKRGVRIQHQCLGRSLVRLNPDDDGNVRVGSDSLQKNRGTGYCKNAHGRRF